MIHRKIVKSRLTKRGCLFTLNVNKFYGTEKGNLGEFLNSIDIIKEDLSIIKWTFDKVDFSFDTELKYNDIFKYCLYIICLLSDITGIKDAIDIHKT